MARQLYVATDEADRAAALARQDVTVPEILVIGRRSQNADIRRLETDIQPYHVATGRQINDADRDNLDQYFRRWMSLRIQSSRNRPDGNKRHCPAIM